MATDRLGGGHNRAGTEGTPLQRYHTQESIDRASSALRDILTAYYADPEQGPAYPHNAKKDVIKSVYEERPPEEGVGFEEGLRLFEEKILAHSVKTWHPRFVNQMFAGVSMPGAVSDLLTSMINPTLATWEMAPAATIVERNASQWMAEILGMPHGSSGIFLPGGSLSNMLALTVARNQRLDTHVIAKGLRHEEKQGVILCSDASHYSLANSANLLGIGKDHLLKVATNERGEMLVEDLKAKLAECDRNDWQPFAIVATMGITVTGGFDPLEDIVALCKERGIHIHVDAAFGGGIALVEEGKALFKGIEHADTVIWDAHKWFHAPVTCTALLAPDAGIFKHVFSSNAEYLYHPQDDEIDLADDLGHYTILCGKRFDALRVWMLLKTYGLGHFRELARERLDVTARFYEALKEDADFEPSYEPTSPIVCWRYLPKDVRGQDVKFLDKMHRWMREEFKRKELGMFNITKFKGCDHFRAVLINPLTTSDHMNDMLESLRELGRAYLAEKLSQPAGSSAS